MENYKTHLAERDARRRTLLEILSRKDPIWKSKNHSETQARRRGTGFQDAAFGRTGPSNA
jgi:hypothetical protein